MSLLRWRIIARSVRTYAALFISFHFILLLFFTVVGYNCMILHSKIYSYWTIWFFHFDFSLLISNIYYPLFFHLFIYLFIFFRSNNHNNNIGSIKLTFRWNIRTWSCRLRYLFQKRCSDNWNWSTLEDIYSDEGRRIKNSRDKCDCEVFTKLISTCSLKMQN